MSHENMAEVRFTQGVRQVEAATADPYGYDPNEYSDADISDYSNEQLMQVISACENLSTACALELQDRNGGDDVA